MTDKLLTIVNQNYNAIDAISLMRESFLHYHPNLAERTVWYCCDGGSSDGALEYCQRHFDYTHEIEPENRFPRIGADELCKMAATPYILYIDSDIEFLNEIVGELIGRMEAESIDCLTYEPLYHPRPVTLCDIYGNRKLYDGASRIDSAFSLWKREPLQRLLQYFSWGRCLSLDTLEYCDSGAVLYRAAMLAGMKVVMVPELRDSVKHYGEVSMMFTPSLETASEETRIRVRAAFERYAEIGRRLKKLRGIE